MKIKSLVDRVALSSIVFSIFAVAVLVLLSGCETTNTQNTGNYSRSIQSPIQSSNDLVLREADTLRIVFPGADALNTTDVIRRDGKITRISEGLTEWRCGDHVGYGWSEYLDQVA